MSRPNPQGTPIPIEAQNAAAAILRPLRAYRPIRHEPPNRRHRIPVFGFRNFVSPNRHRKSAQIGQKFARFEVGQFLAETSFCHKISGMPPEPLAPCR